MKRAAVPSILIAVVLLALGVIAQAQQPKTVPQIGYLGLTESPSLDGAFRKGRCVRNDGPKTESGNSGGDGGNDPFAGKLLHEPI